MADILAEDSAAFPELARQRQAVVVVDVVESVRWMQVDEAGFIHRWRQFVAHVRSVILPSRGGRLVKSLGDGLLLVFAEPKQAAAAALEMLAHLRSPAPLAGASLSLRVGAHVADVVVDEFDIYGNGVNLAARLAGLANPGELVVSAELREQLVDGLDIRVVDLGDCFLKHLSDPVRAFRLEPATSPAQATPMVAAAADLEATIAVVPFVTIRLGIDSAALGVAVADALNMGLSRTAGLRVVSRLSTLALRERSDILDVCRKHLAAAYVVCGRVSHHGHSATLQVELSDTHSCLLLWSETRRISVSGLLAGQDQGVDEIVSAICRCIMRSVVHRVRCLPLPTLAGFTLYVGGVALLHRLSSPDFVRARDVLEFLRERQPRSAAPPAMLAKWHLLSTLQGWSTDAAGDGAKAVAFAQRALALESDNALALSIHGLAQVHFSGDLGAGRQMSEAAIAADPQEAQGWLTLAAIQSYEGNGADAVASASRCLVLSPMDPCRFLFELLVGAGHLAQGHHAEAEAWARSSLRLNCVHAATHRLLIIALSLAGQMPLARAAGKALLAVDPTFRVDTFARRYPGRHHAHAASYVAALRAADLPP